VTFDRSQGLLDKDFQMFYATSDKDIGLTALTTRPLSTDKGYFAFAGSSQVQHRQGVSGAPRHGHGLDT